MSFDDLLEELESLQTLLRRSREHKDLKKRLLQMYSFKNIASPEDDDWYKRSAEEEKAFWILKTSKYGDVLPHFLNLKASLQNKQYFYTIFRGEEIEPAIIKIPRLYPELPPNSLLSLSKKIEVYTSHTDPSKCLGNLVKGKWDEEGRMGIAHWLLFVEIFLILTNNPVKLNETLF